LDTFVCPGTSGWKRIINAMGLAERNIATFSKAGLAHGATGLLTTDWGDHGHFNLLACSWHGIALGAALGWNASHPTGMEFDKQFASVMWGLDDIIGVARLRAASAIAETCETWRLLWMPLAEIIDDPTLPTVDEAMGARQSAQDARAEFEKYAVADHSAQQDLRELSTACLFKELFADRVLHARQAGEVGNESVGGKAKWAERLTDAARAYADCWRARNKESGLVDVLRALAAITLEARAGRR
jgi:hypothetical protein